MKFAIPIIALCASTATALASLEEQEFVADLKTLLNKLPASDDVDYPLALRDLGTHVDPSTGDIIPSPIAGDEPAYEPSELPETHQYAPRCVSAYIPNPNENGEGGDGAGGDGSGDSSASIAGDGYSIFGFWVFLTVAMVFL